MVKIAQEQRVGGKADQPDRPRRLHPHLAERRRQVVGQRSGIRLGPRQRRLEGSRSVIGRRVKKRFPSAPNILPHFSAI